MAAYLLGARLNLPVLGLKKRPTRPRHKDFFISLLPPRRRPAIEGATGSRRLVLKGPSLCRPPCAAAQQEALDSNSLEICAHDASYRLRGEGHRPGRLRPQGNLHRRDRDAGPERAGG